MATEITSKDNATVKAAAKLMNSAKERRQQQRFIAEGVRLCMEALENGCEICELLYTEDAYLRYNESISKLEEAAKQCYLITEEIADKIADTVTPQGVFVVCAMKHMSISLEKIKTDGQYILLENLQDPSNIGAIFRTAEALGLDGAFLTTDCCDPFNPKAMRASMGALFRLPYLVVGDAVKTMGDLKARNMRPIASVPDDTVTKIVSVRFFRGAIMCIGNEGKGLTEKLKNVCGERVTIPMNGRAESLNAATAAAILMWEMVRNYA
ncbi:MAG: RNA methyltransferase [Ruminococcaceae bacterium]|nr:RNA methyltransferase [Oscillospiraceae bacterium]